MNNNDPLNRRIKRVLKDRTKNQKINLYSRLIFRLIVYRISCLLTKFFVTPRARVHWIGYRRRPIRPERFLIVSIFVSATIFLEPRDVAVWAAVWGGTTSIAVVMVAIYTFIPRWIDRSQEGD